MNVKTLSNTQIQQLRVNYSQNELDESMVGTNPKIFFEKWFNEAVAAQCDEPNAMVLSTCANHRPSSRVVLFKGFDEEGLVFYTNYESKKGQELNKNPFVSLNFLWLPLQRQVRIEGLIMKCSSKLSDDYFNSRPRGSRLGATASPQSTKVESRVLLEDYFNQVEKQYPNESDIPRPINWGGYKVVPDYWEFWQGRKNRLHDRVFFKLQDDSWSLGRLAP